MNYLKISNAGILDVEALTLLGASSKREDSTKIGMFGSGNKYALAYLLRNNYEVRIYAGKTEITLGTTEKKFRDRSFSAITINGAETSITTDFGKDWALWQSLRELYCNAIDEGGHKLEYVQSISPSENETHFYIKSRAEITGFVGDFDNYFSENRKVLFECEYGKILAKDGGKLNLYRKGIRCFETDKNSIYDYDLKDVDIDENRLAKYGWMMPSLIWNLVYQCTNKEVIKNVLFHASEHEYVECIGSDFDYVNKNYMSEEFKDVLKELTLAPIGLSGLISTEELGTTTILPNTIFKQAKTIVGNESLSTKFKVYKTGFFIEIETDALHEATLSKAKEFFFECNYSKVFNYPVIVARFTDKEILGFADEKEQRIVLSEICMAKGVQVVIETLIEEFIHLHYDVKDETRSFQNAAITEIVSLLKVNNAFVV